MHHALLPDNSHDDTRVLDIGTGTCNDKVISDNDFTRLTQVVAEGLSRFRSNFYGARKLRARFETAGFKNIRTQILEVAIGSWSEINRLKEIGEYMRATIVQGIWGKLCLEYRIEPADLLKGTAMATLTRGLGWSMEDAEASLLSVNRALNDERNHTSYRLYIVCGQKA